MNTSTLVRHPAPIGTESLAGYVLRLMDVNGYSRASQLYRVAGMSAAETPWKSFNYDKFSAMVGVSGDVIRHMGFGSDPTLLGHPVSKDELNLGISKFCPECVAEKGHIDASFNLDLMVGCPDHRKVAAYYCGRCKKCLQWTRSGMLSCSCDTSIVATARELSDAQASLLRIIKNKVHGEPNSDNCVAGLPVAQLMKLELDSMLRVIRHLGKTRLASSRSYRFHMGIDVLCAAARVLEDWPRGYLKLLSEVCPWKGPCTQEEPLDIKEVYAQINHRFEM